MKRIAILSTIFVVIAQASTQISWNITNKYGLKLLAAFEAQDNSHVVITFRGSQGAGHPGVKDYDAKISFRTPIRDPDDTNAEYVKKRVSLIIDAVRLAHQRKIDQDAVDGYIANAPVIDVNEPDKIAE